VSAIKAVTHRRKAKLLGISKRVRQPLQATEKPLISSELCPAYYPREEKVRFAYVRWRRFDPPLECQYIIRYYRVDARFSARHEPHGQFQQNANYRTLICRRGKAVTRCWEEK
jgi:hypothetical protein